MFLVEIVARVSEGTRRARMLIHTVSLEIRYGEPC